MNSISVALTYEGSKKRGYANKIPVGENALVEIDKHGNIFSSCNIDIDENHDFVFTDNQKKDNRDLEAINYAWLLTNRFRSIFSLGDNYEKDFRFEFRTEKKFDFESQKKFNSLMEEFGEKYFKPLGDYKMDVSGDEGKLIYSVAPKNNIFKQ